MERVSLLLALAACAKAPPDPDTVRLVALSQTLTRSPEESLLDDAAACHIIAQRAQDEALSIEERGAPEQLSAAQRRRLFRLHLLAAELIEYATATPPHPFYVFVDGVTVNLHDVRAAQLARLDPRLLEDKNATVQLRRVQTEFLMRELEKRPGWTDDEHFLSLLE